MSDVLPSIEGAVVIEQLPVIRERLEAISGQAKARVSEALAMEVTEETLIAVKAARADLNRGFEALESRRKAVKAAILQPYNEFEQVYKTLISQVYADGIDTLGKRVNAVTGALLRQKADEVQRFFEEYKESRRPDLGFISIGRAGLNITQSASMKSLKGQAGDFIDRACSDMEAIEASENSAEILAEYRRTLDLGVSVAAVRRRLKEIKEIEGQKARAEAARLERLEQAQPELTAGLPAPDAPGAPVTAAPAPVILGGPGDGPVLTLTFTVTAPKPKLKALKQFLTDGGYDFR
jgi:hypothetical protein